MNENIRKAVAYLVEVYGPTVLEAPQKMRPKSILTSE